MRSQFLPFSTPSISEEEIRDVVDVLRSGWITTGAKCGRFEDAFSEYTGARVPWLSVLRRGHALPSAGTWNRPWR